MRSDSKEKGTKRMELKYCEHCGGLWVREGGAGVYCGKCEEKVADLPKPRRRAKSRSIAGPRKVVLPRGPRTVVDEYEVEIGDTGATDMEAAGGVA